MFSLALGAKMKSSSSSNTTNTVPFTTHQTPDASLNQRLWAPRPFQFTSLIMSSPPTTGLVGLKTNPQMAALLGEVVEPLTHVDSVPEVEHQKWVFIQPFLF